MLTNKKIHFHLNSNSQQLILQNTHWSKLKLILFYKRLTLFIFIPPLQLSFCISAPPSTIHWNDCRLLCDVMTSPCTCNMIRRRRGVLLLDTCSIYNSFRFRLIDWNGMMLRTISHFHLMALCVRSAFIGLNSPTIFQKLDGVWLWKHGAVAVPFSCSNRTGGNNNWSQGQVYSQRLGNLAGPLTLDL